MKQQIYDYKDYGSRIYEKLKEIDPIKYKYISKKSIIDHIFHINYCITQILSKASTEFISPYFNLIKGYRHIKTSHDDRIMRRKYYNVRMKELSSRVQKDNVCDKLNIINCVFKTSWDGKVHDFDTKSYVWKRIVPFNYSKPYEQ